MGEGSFIEKPPLGIHLMKHYCQRVESPFPLLSWIIRRTVIGNETLDEQKEEENHFKNNGLTYTYL